MEDKVYSLEEYARQKNRERFETPVNELSYEELWKDLAYCWKQIGEIEFFPPGYLAKTSNKFEKRILEIRREIEKRIKEEKDV